MPRVYKKRQKIDDISALVETHTDVVYLYFKPLALSM